MAVKIVHLEENAEEMHFRLRSKNGGTGFLDFARNDAGGVGVFCEVMCGDSGVRPINTRFGMTLLRCRE